MHVSDTGKLILAYRPSFYSFIQNKNLDLLYKMDLGFCFYVVCSGGEKAGLMAKHM